MENPGEGRTIYWAHSMNPTHLPPKAPLPILDSGNSLLIGLTNRSGLYKHQHQRTPSASFIPQVNLPWIDDILESPDCSTRKSSHRRSASDSVAVLDPSGNPTTAENARKPGSFSTMPNTALETWTLDKRNVTATSENPSTPSDSNSVNGVSNEDLTSGSLSAVRSDSEVQSISGCDCGFQIKGDSAAVASNMELVDVTMDPKRAKRILANRQSAQRSRVRKLQYIAELERSVNALQIEVTTLTPQVSYLDHRRVMLNMDNNTLKQRIAALIQDKHFEDAHNDALKKEVQRLRLVLQQYHQQQFSKLDLVPPATTEVMPTSDAFSGFLKGEDDLSDGSGIATVEGIGMSTPEAKSLLAQSHLMNLNARNGEPTEDGNIVDECGQLPADFIVQNLPNYTN